MGRRRIAYLLAAIVLLFAAFAAGHVLALRGVDGDYAVHAEETRPQARPVEDLPAETMNLCYDSAGRLDLNAADKAALVELPGIGEALAQRILDYRASIGAFTDTQQLLEVSGIGPAVFAGLQDYITTGGQG